VRYCCPPNLLVWPTNDLMVSGFFVLESFFLTNPSLQDSIYCETEGVFGKTSTSKFNFMGWA
jgi:hypothetical protein